MIEGNVHKQHGSWFCIHIHVTRLLQRIYPPVFALSDTSPFPSVCLCQWVPACIMHWFFLTISSPSKPKIQSTQNVFIVFYTIAKAYKELLQLQQSSTFEVTLVAARVTRGKQPIAYFTLVERKQIQWVRIELKSPIRSKIPPFTPREMVGGRGKCNDMLGARPTSIPHRCMCVNK